MMHLIQAYLLLFVMMGCQQSVNKESAKNIAEVKKSTPKKDTIPQSKKLEMFVDFSAVGDIMLGTNYPNTSTLPPDVNALMAPADSLLKSTDITFGNAEGTFLNQGGQSKGSGPNVYNFRQPEKYVEVLKASGFDFLSIANNHVNDFGVVGLESTAKVLAAQGFAFAGTPAHSFAILERNGLKIGLVAFAPHSGCLDLNDKENVLKLVKASKDSCDILMVSFHGGAEGVNATHVRRTREIFFGQDRGNVYDFAHAVIDAGADVVIGHGPHVPRAMELYKSKLIAYSLGNFCTYAKFSLRSFSSYAPLLQFKLNGNGDFVEGHIHSFQQIGEGGPVTDHNKCASQLIKSLSAQDFPESPLEFDDSGNIRVRK